MNNLSGLVAVMAVAVAGAIQAAGVPGQGTWETTLLGRDINGNPVDGSSASAVFLYDTTLDITWLRDANVNGQKGWDAAVSWAGSYGLGGYSGWRLPNSDQCSGYNCTGSEMGHLWFVELGNTAGGPMSNTGNFENLQSEGHWSGLENAPNPIFAWTFGTSDGFQTIGFKSTQFFALAVRPGDVLSVPEPETYVLMLAGLGALGLATLSRARGVGSRVSAGS